MAALPYMRMYWADYDADTSHLTTMQHGIYLLLIKNYWQRGGPLPNDDDRLAKIARVSPRDWSRNRDTILEFFTAQENLLCHPRLTLELARVEAKSLKCKDAALANAKRTQSKRSSNAERPLIYTEADTDTLAKEANADSDTQFWDAAKAFLHPERKQSGSLIGKWCKDYGKPETAAAITRAQLERPAQRIPFIEGVLRKQANTYDRDRITV